MKKVAFIIVCWNNKGLIAECLESIHSQTYPAITTYLIDNNSSDGSAEYIAENYPNVNLIQSHRNYGFAKGNNIAIKKALKDPEVDYLALLNTDARIEPNWTEQLLKVAEAHPRTASLQARTVDYYDNSLTDSHHIYLADNFQATQAGYKQPADWSSDFTHEVFGVNAAAAIFTRRFIEEQPFNQLFDESFFMYLEDVDVAVRALIMGWKNYFVAGTLAYHMGSASSNKRSSSFSLYYTARNQFGLLIKNLPKEVLWAFLGNFLKFEYHFRRVLKREYSQEAYRAYVKGRRAGVLRMPLYLAKRHKLQYKATIDPDFLKALMKGKGTL